VYLVLLRRAAEDGRLEQARRVFAWNEDTQEEDDGWTVSYLVRNDSEAPVYDVILNAMCGVRGTFVRWLGSFGPGERRRVRILLPGHPRAEYPPRLGFVDTAGRRWVRDPRGGLREQTLHDAQELEREDPGAYENHPTLRLDTPRYKLEGERLA
jgi:hypothetical protein